MELLGVQTGGQAGRPGREQWGSAARKNWTSALPNTVLALGLSVQAYSVAGAPVSLKQLPQLPLHGGRPWLGAGGPLADHQAHTRGAAEVIFGPVGSACGRRRWVTGPHGGSSAVWPSPMAPAATLPWSDSSPAASQCSGGSVPGVPTCLHGGGPEPFSRSPPRVHAGQKNSALFSTRPGHRRPVCPLLVSARSAAHEDSGVLSRCPQPSPLLTYVGRLLRDHELAVVHPAEGDVGVVPHGHNEDFLGGTERVCQPTGRLLPGPARGWVLTTSTNTLAAGLLRACRDRR